MRILRSIGVVVLVAPITLAVTALSWHGPAKSAAAEPGVWFSSDEPAPSDVGGAGSPAPPETIARTRFSRFDATRALSEVVSTSSLGLAVPGRRVVVPGQSVTMQLFDGQRLVVEPLEVAVRTPVENGSRVRARPSVEWLGVVRVKEAISVQVSLAFIPADGDGYGFAGSVMAPGRQVLVSAVDPFGTYRLDELTSSSSLPQGNDISDPPPPAAPGLPSATAEPASATAASAGAPSNVDVILAYGNGNPGDIETRIAAKVAETNNALVASGVNERLNLMTVVYVNYTQHPSNMRIDIDNLSAGLASLGSLHTLREQLRADLVGLVVPNANTHCGFANSIPPMGGSPTVAWQVSANSCFDADRHIIAHEFGHLLGGRHNPEVDPGATPYPYSHGKATPGVARTIMAYGDDLDQAPPNTVCPLACPVSLQYSNPNLDYFGHPGFSSGDASQRNNSLSLNNLASYVATYRTADRLDVNRDGYPDLMAVASRNTGSGMTELHTVAGSSFNGFLSNLVTPLGLDAGRNFSYTAGDVNQNGYPDLIAVASRNTGSGRTEVHTVAGSSFNVFLSNLVTPLGLDTADNLSYTSGDLNRDGYPDLMAVAARNTGSGRIEVHTLAGTGFNTFVSQFVTPLSVDTGRNFSFTAGDVNRDGYPDLMAVASRNTGSARTEVHTLAGPLFNTYISQLVTPLGVDATNDFSYAGGDVNRDGYPDLMAIVSRSTGSARTEVHTLAGPSFNTFISNLVTPLGLDPNRNVSYPR